MPENPTDAASSYVDAVKWVVGLSGAALAGVFLHPEQLPQQPWMKLVIAFAVLLFVVNVCAGVGYLFWIVRVRKVRERLKEIQGEPLAPATKPDPQATQATTKEKDELTQELEGAPKEMQKWWLLLARSGIAAAVFASLVLLAAILLPHKSTEGYKAPPVGDRLRFTITQSPLPRTKNGVRAATFLLNQQTGETWQMICDRQGRVTAFQRVPRLDLNGNPEKDELGKKP